VVDFTRELLQNRKVSRPTFDAATTRFGQRGTMTLTNLIACYAVLAYNMNTYDLEPRRTQRKGHCHDHEALRTILPVAGWDDEKARAVEITGGADRSCRRRSVSARPVPPR